jgi:outer membrane protein OmpA-like peptidoglycan-associated protein
VESDVRNQRGAAKIQRKGETVMRTRRQVGVVIGLMLGLMVSVVPRMQAAETGKLRLWVSPVQSEVFIDGEHMGDASYDGTLAIKKIGAGAHVVGIYCYGFVPQRYTVTIEAGKATGLHVKLQPIETPQVGPWGRIRIKGAPRAGVLLNGKTAAYVVGHADEFDQEFGTRHEELLVRPGTYEVTLVHGGQTIWSGTVKVEADQMVTVNAKTGDQATEKWFGPAGTRPMFQAGLASARVVVEPVTGTFTAEPGTVNCGDSSKLAWSSTGAVEGEITDVGKVGTSGSQDVSPKQTTTYTYKALGPGGEASSSATVNVDNSIQASLEVTPQEVTYKKVGEQVTEQPSATLSWSTSRAKTVEISPLGSVNTSGSRQVTPEVNQAPPGPVDQTVTYTLKAVNACGAEETRTASLHIVGSVEPAVTVTASDVGLALASIFFPTAYPETKRPESGLVKSQAEVLNRLAEAFKKYQAYDQTAKLELEAHADPRGSVKYNQGLSERRAARVKDYLVSQGVPASAVEAKALGEKEELSRTDVKQLEEKNPTPPPKVRARRPYADWLAYNRRVDISLEPAGLQSSKYYPHGAADSGVLWQQPKPRWRVVERVQ